MTTARSPYQPAGRLRARLTLLAGLAVTFALGACQEPVDTALPTEAAAAEYYTSPSVQSVEMNGNVAVVTVVQRSDDLRRGGSLWAKMGPYIHIFSPATEQLLRDHPGLAGVRVRTVTTSDTEIASVLLERSTLNDITWKTARNHVAHALTDEGAEQVRSIERLVQYGERRTSHEYNSNLVRR
ncbi:MAG TPA: hypothetical protein VJ925_13810 [Longimicrobiales bacterium]|nr:hypothetical protein [Longimicrobiales bacterium]